MAIATDATALSLWRAITSFGDSALLLPLLLWLAVWQLARPTTRRDGWRWLSTALLCGGTVALSKLLFMGWGISPPGMNFTGFSGHTALSTICWPATAAVLAQRRPRWRWPLLALAAALALAVGISRLHLKAHSASEVLFGLGLGALLASWFVLGQRPVATQRRWTLALLLGLGLIFASCYGRVFPSQHVLKDLALWLSGRTQVFVRHELLP